MCTCRGVYVQFSYLMRIRTSRDIESTVEVQPPDQSKPTRTAEANRLKELCSRVELDSRCV